MYKQLVCLVLGTLAVGSQAFMPAAPLHKASASSAARVIQPAVPETGACCVGLYVVLVVSSGLDWIGLNAYVVRVWVRMDGWELGVRHRGWTYCSLP